MVDYYLKRDALNWGLNWIPPVDGTILRSQLMPPIRAKLIPGTGERLEFGFQAALGARAKRFLSGNGVRSNRSWSRESAVGWEDAAWRNKLLTAEV